MRREVYPASEHYRERPVDRLLWMSYWIASRTSRQARRARRHAALWLAAAVLTLHVVVRRWRSRWVASREAIRQPLAGTVAHMLPWRD